MFCMYCGKEIKDGIKFCSHCGKPLQVIETFEEDIQNNDIIAADEQKLSKGIVVIITMLVLLIRALAVLAFVYMGGMELLGVIR